MPTVSIIVPAYNASRFIVETIESIRVQTYPDWELVIVDDASTDATFSVVERWIQKWRETRIRLIRLPQNTGFPSRARNHGLRQAKGEFIAFMDADDLYEPDAIESLLSHLLENPDCTAVHGVNQLVDEQLRPLPMEWSATGNVDENGTFHPDKEYRHTLRQFLSTHSYCHLQALMLRRETLDRIGLFNETLYLGEDKNFYLRLFLDSENHFHFLPKVIFRYRHYTNSVTKDAIRDMRRFQTLLDNIPNIAETEANLLADRPDFYVSKAHITAREYRWLLSGPVAHHFRRDALLMLIRHAWRNPQLPNTQLAYCVVIEFIYRTMPGLIKSAKNVKSDLQRLFSFPAIINRESVSA